MVKKAVLLAGVAASSAALALPAVAWSAWTDNGVNIGSNVNLTLAGKMAFVGELGGISCTAASEAWTLSPGTTGEQTSGGATPSSCSGSGGLAFCTIQSITFTATPYGFHTNASSVTITGRNFDVTLSGAFCPFHLLKIQDGPLPGSFTYWPDNTGAFTKFNITGSARLLNGTTEAFVQNVTVSGELNVSPSGTYGIK